MRSLQLKPSSTFEPIHKNLTAKNSPASNLATLQARANLSKVDDLSAVSSVLKAQYKRLSASKLQAQNPELEEEKQGKRGVGKSQASKLQAQNPELEEEKQGKPQASRSKSKLQSKGDWQKKANLSAIFGGGGSSLPGSLMGKYEGLMPGVSLGHVKVFQGASVDQALHAAGLQGLTDGTRVAVSSKAQAGTLEHELGHVAQRQVQGFNLTEGNRESYEQDADRISANLVNNKPVKLQGLTQGKAASPQGKQQNILEAKCAQCDQEQQPKQLLAKTISISGKGQLQANMFVDYWQEFVGCAINGLGWLTTVTLALMKECGATLGRQIINVLIVPIIGLLEKIGGGNNDTNPFGWLTDILYAIWHFLEILKTGIQATVVCIATVVGIIINLISLIWCLISSIGRVKSKIEQKIKDAREAQERQRLERQLQQSNQRQQQLENTVRQLQQEQKKLEQRVNQQQNSQRRRP